MDLNHPSECTFNSFTSYFSQIVSQKIELFLPEIIMYDFFLKKGASEKEIELLEKKIKNRNGVEVKKYCGLIKLKEDALTIQTNLRNE